MSELIRFGTDVDAAVPSDRLDPTELDELHKLLREREAARAQVVFVEQRIQLLLTTARDRRGLTGPMDLDPRSGKFLGTQDHPIVPQTGSKEDSK